MNCDHLAKRISRLGTESAFEVLHKAKLLEAQGKSIIHLEIGQPDFATPTNIIEAAYRAMKEGFTGYTPAQGLLETREAIARYCKKYKNIPAAPEEIVVVPGAKPILFYTMLALVNPGDEVIYPDPGFPIYESCINFVQGVPVSLPILQKNDFKIDINQLKSLITSKTKLIILNNPANPTGGVLFEEDIRAIAQVVKESGAYLLSDEIYDRIVFEGSPFSIASLPDMKDRTIVMDGLSKAYAMTGWRLGYGVMNETLAQKITLLMINSNSCAAAFTQRAAAEALEGPQTAVDRMKSAFLERCTYLYRELNQMDGISCLMPKGSFYLFPSIEGTGMSAKEFADGLLYQVGVSVLAGSSFGQYGEGHIRLSAANSMENLEEAVKRIGIFLETNKK